MAPASKTEIRDLRSLFWSDRDPGGRAFVPLADAFRREGELQEALELLTDGLGRHPEFSSAHVVAAWVHRDRGDLPSAEAAFRRALELDPENARALHGLGQILARAGRVAAGRSLVLRALELDPMLEWEEGGISAKAEEVAEEPAPSAADLAVAEPIDIRELAPAAVAGVVGDPDGYGDIVEIGFLAPDPSPVAEPDPFVSWDEGDAEEEVRDSAGGDAVEALPLVDIETLAPDPEPAEEPVPDAAPAPEPALEPEPELEPDETVRVEEDEAEEADEGPSWDTATMAELYARQGLHERALEVYRRLAAARPDDERLAARIQELEPLVKSEDAPPVETPTPESAAEPDAPEEEEGEDEPSVDAYLQDLLGWTPHDREGS